MLNKNGEHSYKGYTIIKDFPKSVKPWSIYNYRNEMIGSATNFKEAKVVVDNEFKKEV